MIDIFEIKNQLATGKNIMNMPLRVTYYARVSSVKDAQLNSLDNQVEYFESLIKKNENWEMIPGYIDEGIRGESAEKRTEFQRMIEDAKRDSFDLILTKEISRFARNTLDSLKYTRELLSNRVGVFFLTDNINTLDPDSELRLTIMSSIYQDEVRKLSSRVHFGHKQAIKNGVVLGNSRIYGYEKKNGKLIVIPDEAAMVKKIFTHYVDNDYSSVKIQKILYDEGYRSRNGGAIAPTTINAILDNPKYKGYYCGNKVIILDYMTKEQKFLPPDEWVMYKDETGEIVPAIVSENLWNRAHEKRERQNKLAKERRSTSKSESWGNSALSHKIYCECCGAPYWRNTVCQGRSNAGEAFWICATKKKAAPDKKCNSISLFEKDVYLILQTLVADFFNNKTYYVNAFLERMQKALTDAPNCEVQRQQAYAGLEKIKSQKELLFGLYSEGSITKQDYIDRNNTLTAKANSFQNTIDACNNQAENMAKQREQFNRLRTRMTQLMENEENSMKVLLTMVDRISVGRPDANNKINVRVFLKMTDEQRRGSFGWNRGHIFLTI